MSPAVPTLTQGTEAWETAVSAGAARHQDQAGHVPLKVLARPASDFALLSVLTHVLCDLTTTPRHTACWVRVCKWRHEKRLGFP